MPRSQVRALARVARARSVVVARLLVGFAVALSVVAAAAQPASARTRYRLIPRHNVRPPSSRTCTAHPRSVACDAILIRALNRARATLGEPRYRLPGRFTSLAGPEQLLVLSNSDRELYGRAGTELYEDFYPNYSSAVFPYLPTVTGLSRHHGRVRGGQTIVVHGYGLRYVHSAMVVGRHFSWLRIRTPHHARDRGYVVAHTSAGHSRKTYAAAFTYR